MPVMILRNIFLLHQARKNKTNNKYMEKKTTHQDPLRQ